MWNNPDRFKQYLNLKGLKERTILNYLTEFNKFAVARSISLNTLYSYLNRTSKQPYNARAFIKQLKDYLLTNQKEFNLNEDQIEELYSFEVPIVSGRESFRLPKPLSIEKALSLEEYFKTERDKLRFLVCFYCGLRVGELVNIRIDSFNWESWGNNIEGPGEIRVLGKGDKEGIAICPAFLMVRIARHIRNSDYKNTNSLVFGGDHIKKSSRIRSFQLQLREVGIKAGITPLDSAGKPVRGEIVHPHLLRHSFATYLKVNKKKDLLVIKEALRHKDISSTQVYTHLDKEELKKELSF